MLNYLIIGISLAFGGLVILKGPKNLLGKILKVVYVASLILFWGCIFGTQGGGLAGVVCVTYPMPALLLSGGLLLFWFVFRGLALIFRV